MSRIMEMIRCENGEPERAIEAMRVLAGQCFEYELTPHVPRVYMRLNEQRYGKVKAVDVESGAIIVLDESRPVRRCHARVEVY